jgi:hypothetical protein
VVVSGVALVLQLPDAHCLIADDFIVVKLLKVSACLFAFGVVLVPRLPFPILSDNNATSTTNLTFTHTPSPAVSSPTLLVSLHSAIRNVHKTYLKLVQLITPAPAPGLAFLSTHLANCYFSGQVCAPLSRSLSTEPC